MRRGKLCETTVTRKPLSTTTHDTKHATMLGRIYAGLQWRGDHEGCMLASTTNARSRRTLGHTKAVKISEKPSATSAPALVST